MWRNYTVPELLSHLYSDVRLVRLFRDGLARCHDIIARPEHYNEKIVAQARLSLPREIDAIDYYEAQIEEAFEELVSRDDGWYSDRIARLH